MKTLKASVIILLFTLGACKKTSDNSALTTAEAADMIATSLSANSNGLTTNSADMTLNAQAVFDLNIGCGNTKTYTFTRQNPVGDTITYNYALNYAYTLNCNSNNLPDNVTGTSTETGTFDGPRLAANGTGSSSFRVAGLTPTATVYVLNGEYKRSVTYTSKIGSKNTSTAVVDLVVTNFTVSKSTKVITGGSAVLTITGTSTKNVTLNFSGSVTFTGDGKGTVTINGVVYIVDLITGQYTKK